MGWLDIERAVVTVEHAGTQVDLVARTVRLRLPFWQAVAYWSRPVGVVQRAPGRRRWYPVRDHARLAQAAMLGVLLAVFVLVWRVGHEA